MRFMTRTEMLAFRAPRGLIAELRRKASEQETSVSELLRQAAQAHLDPAPDGSD